MEKIMSLDGTLEEQTTALKEFFGLKPNQSFQNMDIEETDDE